MIKKASIYTMNALNKSSELWNTSVNRKARLVVEGEHNKSWNDDGHSNQPIKRDFSHPATEHGKIDDNGMVLNGWLARIHHDDVGQQQQ